MNREADIRPAKVRSRLQVLDAQRRCAIVTGASVPAWILLEESGVIPVATVFVFDAVAKSPR